ncbi:TIGR01212 family radical SAM protein [Ruminococcus sp.]|uniref:TIGR01212 family radical SAM protein n=1 Tax=Ruminococcus sp. TaxID=41978 RepID=UPI0025E206DF|nr:TIGR01212 family radical SAM protein [Ruminococcus sp.]MCR4638091.1 TIGR01212 family radical SAM protein [Ruminococcus sp.]
MGNNPFKYSNDNKRYNTLNFYNKHNFGKKIYKAVIDLGLTCPNIDGSKGTGGCIFCDSGSGYFTHKEADIESQLKTEKERICSKSGGDAEFIAYFQANTNTYAPVQFLRKAYYAALDFPNVFGISIGTRADCLSEEIIKLLSELNHKTHLTVELGMQSCHEKTISLINRCCTHEEFKIGYYKLKNAGIRTCLHIINGLPHESKEDMLETARELAILRPEAVKLQMLHVIKGTRLADMYSSGEFKLLERDEYIDIIVHQLELLPPEIVIERITGDGDKRKLIAPMWSADKISVLGGIDKKLAELDTWQGKLYIYT